MDTEQHLLELESVSAVTLAAVCALIRSHPRPQEFQAAWNQELAEFWAGSAAAQSKPTPERVRFVQDMVAAAISLASRPDRGNTLSSAGEDSAGTG